MSDDVDRLTEEIVAAMREPVACLLDRRDMAAAVASLLRARLPRWVEVTDDPASLPPDTDDRVLVGTRWFFADGGTEDDAAEVYPARGARTLAVRRRQHCSRGAGRSWCQMFWMPVAPWPASPAKEAAMDDRLTLDDLAHGTDADVSDMGYDGDGA